VTHGADVEIIHTYIRGGDAFWDGPRLMVWLQGWLFDGGVHVRMGVVVGGGVWRNEKCMRLGRVRRISFSSR
jgi:hypothetical protein